MSSRGVEEHHRWSHTWLGTDRLFARRLARPVARFLSIEAASGLLLLAATVIALVWANSPWRDSYAGFLDTEVSLVFGSVDLHLTVLTFVNDALMALFFFVVGVEIKRELVKGELRDRRAAALPIIGALGGMIVPALVYFVINAGTPESHGWGIPMATDIAFAVGIVSLSGKRVPAALKVFLLSLAVADDLGAITVIAIFYSSSVSFLWLVAALVLLVVVWVLRRRRVWFGPLYFVLGVVVWYCTYRSGVHPTVAGVAMGFLIPIQPLRPDLGAAEIADRLENQAELTAADVENAAFLIRESVPVGDRIVDRWLPWTSYVVIPIFALCNAGVALSGEALSAAVGSRVTWGVAVGLVVGKTIGVFGAASLAIAVGIARRPRGATTLHLLGIAMAAGIGFTVALFVTSLAFDTVEATDQAKVGVLAASLVAAVLSTLMLRLAAARASDAEMELEAMENEVLFAETAPGVVIDER
ncbi:MAG: Na+/H+ antiporter NhaA [Acidimicrobiia bacterium]|nr:Na+/H+ antiporter NhaA [Acidimicrobiia bacterium]